jgi:hypothetical protein
MRRIVCPVTTGPSGREVPGVETLVVVGVEGGTVADLTGAAAVVAALAMLRDWLLPTAMR